MASQTQSTASCADAVRFQLRKADILAVAGRFSEARIAYLKAISADTSPHARNEYACFLLRGDCHQEAIGQFQILIHDAVRTGDTGLKAMAANNLAAVYREIGDTQWAARWQQQSIEAELLRPAGETLNSGDGNDALVCDLSNRANDALAEGQLDLAERLLIGSLMLEVGRRSPEGLAASFGSLGLLAMFRGDYRTALVLLWRAYRIHNRQYDHRGAGFDLMNLAEMCRRMGRYQSAVRCLRRAIHRLECVQSTAAVAKARILLREALRTAEVFTHDPSLN